MCGACSRPGGGPFRRQITKQRDLCPKGFNLTAKLPGAAQRHQGKDRRQDQQDISCQVQHRKHSEPPLNSEDKATISNNRVSSHRRKS